MIQQPWPVPKYSRNEVNRSGKYLVENSDIFDRNYYRAFIAVDNWRNAHLYPLNTFQATLRAKAPRIDRNAIVAQRLKRLPSILSKLSLNPSMQLSRMQDIVGLRAVVYDSKKASLLIDNYRSTKFDHELKNEHDYISQPKDSGYRSHHLVYRYANKFRPEYDGLLIEIQIRTKIQHSWAMAVETMGVYLNSSLKSGLGPEDWKNFFFLASSAFALYEQLPTHPSHHHLPEIEIIKSLNESAKQLHVIDKLRALTSATNTIASNTARSYYVIDLDIKRKLTRLYAYSRDDLAIATKKYSSLERETQNDPDRNIVLVSAGSVASLKKAYPSYFLDTKEFISTLKTIISNCT